MGARAGARRAASWQERRARGRRAEEWVARELRRRGWRIWRAGLEAVLPAPLLRAHRDGRLRAPLWLRSLPDFIGESPEGEPAWIEAKSINSARGRAALNAERFEGQLASFWPLTFTFADPAAGALVLLEAEEVAQRVTATLSGADGSIFYLIELSDLLIGGETNAEEAESWTKSG